MLMEASLPRDATGAETGRFRGNDLIVFHVLDRQELEFDFTDPSAFEDLESGEQIPIVPEALGDQYRALVQAHITALTERFSANRIDYTLVNTSSPPPSARTSAAIADADLLFTATFGFPGALAERARRHRPIRLRKDRFEHAEVRVHAEAARERAASDVPDTQVAAAVAGLPHLRHHAVDERSGDRPRLARRARRTAG